MEIQEGKCYLNPDGRKVEVWCISSENGVMCSDLHWWDAYDLQEIKGQIYLEEGQIYSTGNILFEIDSIHPVTKCCYKVNYRLLNAGAFSEDVFTVDEDVIINGIKKGSIKLMTESQE